MSCLQDDDLGTGSAERGEGILGFAVPDDLEAEHGAVVLRCPRDVGRDQDGGGVGRPCPLHAHARAGGSCAGAVARFPTSRKQFGRLHRACWRGAGGEPACGRDRVVALRSFVENACELRKYFAVVPTGAHGFSVSCVTPVSRMQRAGPLLAQPNVLRRSARRRREGDPSPRARYLDTLALLDPVPRSDAVSRHGVVATDTIGGIQTTYEASCGRPRSDPDTFVSHLPAADGTGVPVDPLDDVPVRSRGPAEFGDDDHGFQLVATTSGTNLRDHDVARAAGRQLPAHVHVVARHQKCVFHRCAGSRWVPPSARSANKPAHSHPSSSSTAAINSWAMTQPGRCADAMPR